MSKQTDEAKNHGGMNRPMSGGGNSGEKTEDLRKPDEALADKDLLTSVEDRLSNLRGITGSTLDKPAAEDLEVDDNDSTKPDEKKDGEEKPSKSDPSTLDKEDGTDVPILPDAYVRAAVAYGWKKEDVIQSFQNDPEQMLGVLSNIYNTRNRASAEFAALGRKHAAETAAKESVTSEKSAFQPIDTKGLRDKYGDEANPLIDVIEAQNKMLQQVVGMVPTVKKQDTTQHNTAFNSTVEESGVEQQIYAFFDTDTMKPYEKVYGKLGVGETFSDLSQSQHQNRWNVLQKADLIAGGARLQGVELPLSEALEMAHLLVTQRYRDQILVEGIKEKVVRRGKSLSLKPTDGKKIQAGADDQSGPRTRDCLVSDVQGRLNKMFNGD